MYTVWTQHIKDPEDKQRFHDQIKNAKPVLDRLAEILDQEELGLDRSEQSIKSFDTPNWDYKQAFKNGCRSEIHTIKDLIDLDHRETK